MYKKNYDLLKETLNLDQVTTMADFILSEQIKPEASASLLKFLNAYKDPTILLNGFSKSLKDKSLNVKYIPGAIDVCGTGGDGHHTFNISTTVSLLLALVMPVIKHGNTSISSLCGSADVIKAFNIPFLNDSEKIHQSIKKNNFVFLYAPYMHPKMKNVMPIRKRLGIPTIFNHIGPLCNPCRLDYQIIGVYDENLMLPMAKALQETNILKGAVVYGYQGMDELSTGGINKVIYVTKNRLIHDTIDPLDLNISTGLLSDYKGGSTQTNVNITYDILNGMKGPKQDIVALNAGLALYITGYEPSLLKGVKRAYKLLNSKKAIKIINKLSGGTYEHFK
jgi:anthranilate phosphoribosyltransferase